MRKYTVVDVGANHGQFGLEVAKKRDLVDVFLFEPIPELAEYIRSEIDFHEIDNAHVYPVAIALSAGQKVMGVSRRGDWGTSSLLAFDMDKVSKDPYWALRPDLGHDDQRVVDVITLETFVADNDIKQIDFIKIDVQGMDLDVIASAGEGLNKIQAGMIEVPSVSESALYKNELQNLQVALNQLTSYGFDIVAIKPNDPACNEFNVFFSRTPSKYREMVNVLGLVGVEMFDGKDYWHCPSSSPVFVDKEHIRLVSQAELLVDRVDKQDGEIMRLSRRIADQDNEINRLNNFLLAHDDGVASKTKHLERRIKDLGNEVLRLTKRIEMQDGEIHRLRCSDR